MRGEAAEQPPVLRMVVICPAHHSDAVHRATATAAVLDIQRQSGYLPSLRLLSPSALRNAPSSNNPGFTPRARICVHLRTRCGGTCMYLCKMLKLFLKLIYTTSHSLDTNGLIPNHHRVTPLIPNRVDQVHPNGRTSSSRSSSSSFYAFLRESSIWHAAARKQTQIHKLRTTRILSGWPKKPAYCGRGSSSSRPMKSAACGRASNSLRLVAHVSAMAL